MKRPRRVKIVVGTRGSELALRQTRLVVDRLQARWAGLKFEIKVIKTRGDDAKTAIRDVRAGRKGLFTGAIERALLRKEIDLAVHSAKDLPSRLALGTEIAAVLPRAAVGDVLVATTPCDLNSLAADGIVATGSVRRKHQLRWKRPDLEIDGTRSFSRMRGWSDLGCGQAMGRSILKAANFSLLVFRARFFCPLADRALSPCKYARATNSSGKLSMLSLILTPGLRCARSANFCGYWMRIATNPSECWQSLMDQR
jgi:hydroxymethylbilane synthase